MHEETNYRYVSKSFSCSNCGKKEKKLVHPNENKTICTNCNNEAFETNLGEFNREELDRTYRIIFNQNGEQNRVRNQYHNRTDIFDRNRANVYADPRERVIHLSQEEINRRNSMLNSQQFRSEGQTSSRFPENRNSTRTPNANSNVNISPNFDAPFSTNNHTNGNTNGNDINANLRRQSGMNSWDQSGRNSERSLYGLIFDFPIGSLISPFNGSINRHPFQHRYSDFFSDLFFGQPSDDFFSDNYASNFSSNFFDPMTRIIFIRTAANHPGRDSSNRPATSEALKRLKKFKMDEDHAKKDNKGEIEYPSCSICLLEVNKGENTILVPCGHMYHEPCILKWFEVNNRCPVCRFDLIEFQNTSSQQNQQNLNFNTNGNSNSNNNPTPNSSRRYNQQNDDYFSNNPNENPIPNSTSGAFNFSHETQNANSNNNLNNLVPNTGQIEGGFNESQENRHLYVSLNSTNAMAASNHTYNNNSFTGSVNTGMPQDVYNQDNNFSQTHANDPSKPDIQNMIDIDNGKHTNTNADVNNVNNPTNNDLMPIASSDNIKIENENL